MEEENKEMKSFKDLGLSEQLVEACEKFGWKNPKEIQTEVIPLALQGKDVIGISNTGSGKTGAFVLPILHALELQPHLNNFFACVMSPTRELGIQIAGQFKALGSEIGVKCAVLVGGTSMVQQSIDIAKRPHIIVGTPGRLLDHLKHTKGFSLGRLKYLVLDESDRLLNEDFEKELIEILGFIPSKRGTFLFSATGTDKVRKIGKLCLRDPVKIEISSKYSTVDTLKQQCCFVPAKHKTYYLVYILTEMTGSTSMIFTWTCDSSRLLASTLRNFGLKAISINGHMSQHKRLQALEEFKSGKCNIVLCTDVLSRGLDIEAVDMVINYDIPTDPKIYIHRVGRTARAGRSGVAISLLNQYELLWFRQIEEQMDKKLPLYPAQCEEVMLLKERVDTAKRLAEKVMFPIREVLFEHLSDMVEAKASNSSLWKSSEIKESGEKKKWRGEGDLGEEDEDIDKYLGLFSSRKKKFFDLKDRRSSKKFRR